MRRRIVAAFLGLAFGLLLTASLYYYVDPQIARVVLLIFIAIALGIVINILSAID